MVTASSPRPGECNARSRMKSMHHVFAGSAASTPARNSSPMRDKPPPSTIISGCIKWVTCDNAKAKSSEISLKIF